MTSKLVVGPFSKGLRNDVTAFNIDNDSFPVLTNAYQWRGRVKRKRGTSSLTRLERSFTNQSLGNASGAGGFSGNIFSILGITEGSASLDPNNFIVADGGNIFTSANQDGILAGSIAGSGTINYATGALVINNGSMTPGNPVTTTFGYFPNLSVMGLEDLTLQSTQYPGTLGFDTKYSYNIPQTSPYTSYDVSFYKNPATGTFSGYTTKGTQTRFTWNGNNYQQFWSTNYLNAFWATNGIAITNNFFDPSTLQMQYASGSTTPTLTAAAWVSATSMTFTINGNPLVVGDFVFANEFTASAGGDASKLNWQTGYVTAAGNTFTVVFPNANIPAGTYSPGLLQYLTNRSHTSKDCIRWYDGDPTTANSPNGWVNFCPPIFQSAGSIANLPSSIYYLIGARIILPFKDRLVFFGPVIQSNGATPIYLQDTVIYSQNGTPYYTASFNGSPTSAATTFNAILTPPIPNTSSFQTASAAAYFADSTGFGGFHTVGVNKPIVTVGGNEDALILGFSPGLQVQMVYTGNDINPFAFFTINSELGSGATFSAISLDKGILSYGNRGFIVTSQTGAARIDLDIPDQVFEVNLTQNGAERITAIRDFIQEWIYFTYRDNQANNVFPNETLQYNYRDNSWGIFNETYTTYGLFRPTTGYTWLTIPWTWNTWNTPWNAGSSTVLQVQTIAGNQQGFVLVRGGEPREAPSLFIQGISGNTITSPNHSLNVGDYIIISGVTGTNASLLNGKVFSVSGTNYSNNTFDINPNISGSVTYTGGGLITRMYVPQIRSKEFPTGWALSRKTRIGAQRYLLTWTENAQVTLQMFLSQNETNPYNAGSIVPTTIPQPDNSGLIYSQVLFTSPESGNLQMSTADMQEQIWHRVNTSLIGDTVQVGITLSDDQMRTLDDSGNPISQFAEIELHGFIIDVYPSQVLA